MKLGVATVAAAALAATLAVPAGAQAIVVKLDDAPGVVRLDGRAADDHAATSVANAGDVNGDGHPDFIVGAPSADNRSRTDSGSAYVVYGGPGLAGVKHRNLGANGFRIDGAMPGDAAGFSVARAGDFNGDGVDDVIVGAFDANPGGLDNAGAAYVIYGQRTADLTNVDLANLKTAQDARGMEIDGAAIADGTGESVSGGRDINFDQVPDVVVAAPAADNVRQFSGSTFVIYGQQTADPADVDLTKIDNAQGARGMEIDGTERAFSGFPAAASRDLNDDGIADVLIGATFTSNNMRRQSGSVYVVYGMNGDDVPDVDLANITTTEAARGMRIDGAQEFDVLSGMSVAGGRDLNGDGIADAVLGFASTRFGDRQDAGVTYVIYGRPGDPPDLDLAQLATTQAARGMRIIGADGGDESGFAVDVGGDVNGDGHPDAIVGADTARNGHSNSGSAYVVYGRGAADPTDVDLAKITTTQKSRGFRIDGAAAQDRLGTSVAATAGDLNADRRPDVIVGSPFAHNNGPESGSAYVVGFPR